MKSLAVGCLLALLALPAMALEPYLVKDINPAPTPDGSDPSSAVTFGGAVLFFAEDGISGPELWRSDGTAAGTFPLSDGAAGPAPQPFVVTEHLYFFVSSNPIEGFASLWVSDGTAAGTFRLTDPDVGVVGRPRVWIASQGVLYFTGRDSEHGIELWRTDGTPAGTHLVADIWQGPQHSNISAMTEYKGQVWFGADDGLHGGSLWRSDGTAAGTVLAVDPFPASAVHESPEFVQAVGSRITFFTRPPSEEPGPIQELWGGDGTAGGTVRISAGKTIYDRIVRGNRLYFIGENRKGQELWVSDGTRPGTRPLTNFPKFEAFESANLPLEGLNDGRFLFRADDGIHGLEPWVTDGTPKGTRLLRDLCPGLCSSVPIPRRVFAGRLYFTAADANGENHLWSTNGTAKGTWQVSGIDFWQAHTFSVADGRLFFVALTEESGWELWRTDGTARGTFPVTDFENRFIWEEEGFHGAVLGGVLLFRGEDGQHGAELWRTDGTVAGTGLVEDINQIDIGGSFPKGLMPLGDEVVFVVPKDGVLAPELWKSDGTEAGTVRFRTFEEDELDGSRPLGAFAEAGGLLFYFGYELGDTYVPWRTDGTAAGTFRLTEEAAPSCCTLPEKMEAVGSLVFFALRDEEHGRELWVSDGTREGTRLVLDIVPGAVGSEPVELTAFQGRLYFTTGGDRRLWTSDGTAAGTVPFVGLEAGGEFLLPTLFTVHAGRLWFFAADDAHGRELWSSDGTEVGTRLEVEFEPGSGSTEAVFMVSLGDRLVISIYGKGVWATDGTPAGTRKIHDRDFYPVNQPHVVFQGRLYYVSPGDGSIWVTDGTEAGTGPFLDHEGREIFSPARYTVLGDRLVFTAAGHFGTLTLWESDGTPAGTFPVQPEVRLNDSTALVRAGDRVFFPSYDISTGWELWAVRP